MSREAALKAWDTRGRTGARRAHAAGRRAWGLQPRRGRARRVNAGRKAWGKKPVRYLASQRRFTGVPSVAQLARVQGRLGMGRFAQANIEHVRRFGY